MGFTGTPGSSIYILYYLCLSYSTLLAHNPDLCLLVSLYSFTDFRGGDDWLKKSEWHHINTLITVVISTNMFLRVYFVKILKRKSSHKSVII